jgi:hypothetical protein
MPGVTVFVPTLPVAPGDADVQIVMRQVEPDLVVVLAYSSLPLLVAGCSAGQAWAALPAEVLDGLLPSLGASGVLLDVPLPESDRVPA